MSNTLPLSQMFANVIVNILPLVGFAAVALGLQLGSNKHVKTFLVSISVMYFFLLTSFLSLHVGFEKEYYQDMDFINIAIRYFIYASCFYVLILLCRFIFKRI